MATTSRATGVPLPIPTLLIIKEITSSNILYEALVLVSLFCIFQILNAFLIHFSGRIIDFAGLGRQKRYQWVEPCLLREEALPSLRFCLRKKGLIWTDGGCLLREEALPSLRFCLRKKGLIWTDGGSGCVFAEKGVKYYLSSLAPRVLFKGSVERNNYSRSRPGNSISNLPQKLEIVKFFAKRWAQAHIGNGGTELKAYKKSRTTHQGKYGHNVGSTDFSIWAQGGDGSGEEWTIQDCWGSPDTTVNSSVQMTSPPRKTTPQTQPPPTPPPPQTPPSSTLRATPQVQPPTPAPQYQPPTSTPQVQPPSPSPTSTPAPAPPPPPPPRGWFNFNFAGWFTFNFTGWFNFNVTDLAKIFLAISATLVIAPPQIVQSGGNSLSDNDKTLLFGTKLFGLVGFIFCLLAYMIGQANIAAKLLTAFGVVADIFGLLLVVALGR
ncbi:hypothetical protein CICLE_v10020207mg [Citrus x clementina]|uniref:Uncharacterized protein n=1 Tax=Citrus clementina TaxID=85681 RepID=V4VSS4_CITCL|nr:hypothetical protein CICLE_v10020207mg [Citrus x clementina]